MKGSASGYGVSGSGEVSRMDYQERRKDTVIGFGMLLAFVAIVGVALWYIASKFTDAVPKLPDPFQMYKDATEKTVADAAYSVAPEEAINLQGEYYPVTTQDGLRQRLDAAVTKPLIVAGDVITGGAAVQAGANAALTVNKLGLNDAYVNLDPLSKTFVSVGEGLGNIVGISPITMGYNMRADVQEAAGVVTPTKSASELNEYDNYIGA